MGKKIEYLLIKKKDDFCNTIDQFINLLKVNVKMIIKDDIIIDKTTKYKIKFYLKQKEIEINKEISFLLRIETLDNTEDEKNIKILENFDKNIIRVIEKAKFCMYTVWDDVSSYYGTMLYPKLNYIENKMRKIIYIFMINNRGSKCFKKDIPMDVKSSIEKTQKKNKLNDIDSNILYSADFIKLCEFLFKKYPMKKDIEKLLADLKKINKNNVYKIDRIIQEYELKSNYERYFSDIIVDDNILIIWKKLYEYRNKVAHNKKINNKDYLETMHLVKKADQIFNKCLEKVDNIKIPSDEQNKINELVELAIENSKYTNTFLGSQYKNVSPIEIIQNRNNKNLENLADTMFKSSKELNKFFGKD